MIAVWGMSGPVVSRVAIVMIVFMAVALQIQPNIYLQGHVVRFSVSDLLLLPSLLLVARVAQKNPRQLPLNCIFWAAAFCVVLTASYFTYMHVFGAPTKWGTIKVIGGYVLLDIS